MHNPESVLENETHKILCDFQIQTDHLISARRPDLMIINKKKNNLRNRGLCCPDCSQYLDLTRQLKKLWNMKVTIIPIVIGALSTVTQGLVLELDGLKIRGREESTLLRSARIRKRVLET